MSGGNTNTNINVNNNVNENVNQNQTSLENYTHNYNVTNDDHHIQNGELIAGDKNTLTNYVNAAGGHQCFGGGCMKILLII